jgi:uncharacterized protein YkwD
MGGRGRFVVLCLPTLFGLAGCGVPASEAADLPARVAYRPGDLLPALGPDARVDRGLRAAAEELAADATSPDARLTPTATRTALGRAGYPGDARFLAARGGKELPADLLAALPHGAPVDLGWSFRDLPDGSRWWVVGWAPRRASMDPVPRDLAVGQGLALRVDDVASPRLLLGRPDGGVDDIGLVSGTARWVARFDVPGEYRVEVVDGDAVDLLFSLFVGGAAPAAATPLPGAATTPQPETDLPFLYAALDDLRGSAGLPPLARFADFEPHARAHGACLAAAGVVAHDTPTCPGVPELAKRTHFPRARHTEDVAAGDTAEEAWERVLASPGHRLNLLCKTCTHVAIGASLEGADPPREYVVWEVLEFPDGRPMPVPNTH